ncbi:tetratricopeptide repeat protein [Thermodesulfobium sp.]
MQNMQLKKLIEECFDYIKSQDYQRALQSGRNLIVKYPNSVGTHWCLGKVYYYLARFNPNYFNFSIEELRTARTLARFINNKSDERVLAATCSEFGDDCKKRGLIDWALRYYKESLENYTDLNDTDLNDIEGKCIVLTNIAEIYKMFNYNKALEYYNKAIECFKEAIEISQKNGDYSKTAHAMINIALPYTNLKDFLEAERYLAQGLEMVKKLGERDWEAFAYEVFGKLYLAQNQEDLARKYFTKSYNLYKAIGNNSEAQRIYETYLKQ